MKISLMSVDESYCDASHKTLEIRKIRLLCLNKTKKSMFNEKKLRYAKSH